MCMLCKKRERKKTVCRVKRSYFLEQQENPHGWSVCFQCESLPTCVSLWLRALASRLPPSQPPRRWCSAGCSSICQRIWWHIRGHGKHWQKHLSSPQPVLPLSLPLIILFYRFSPVWMRPVVVARWSLAAASNNGQARREAGWRVFCSLINLSGKIVPLTEINFPSHMVITVELQVRNKNTLNIMTRSQSNTSLEHKLVSDGFIFSSLLRIIVVIF